MNRRQAHGICAASLVVVVLPIMSGCFPKNFFDPHYDYDYSTTGYSFETPHEPAAVYRALLAVVEDDGRKIEERFDDELKMTVSYPADRISWLPAGVMTIECFGADMGTKCLFVPPTHDNWQPFTVAVEPIVDDLQDELEK